MSKKPREGINFFPLSVDFEEKLYAAGRIPGNWFRREGRPPESAILIDRLIDRPLRPLFPNDMRNEVQVILYALSHDQEHQEDVLGVCAASAALTISDVPWEGPIGAVRVAIIDGEFVINPTYNQMEDTVLDLRLAASADAILMVECGAKIVSEDVMVEALRFGHEAIQPIIAVQHEMREAVGKPKSEYPVIGIADDFRTSVSAEVQERIRDIVTRYYDRDERDAVLEDLREQVMAEYEEDEEYDDIAMRQVGTVFKDVVKEETRRQILEEGVRPDGRDSTTIRELSADVRIMPRVHGSGLFQRGETQVLSLATLGTPRDARRLDGLNPAESKRYMHHYNFPPFSTGETWFMRGPKRREIGHGALAENALRAVLPEQEDFPYTVRVVSEVLSSNGSTSMASVCGSTLALLDAGAPLKAPVAGIAMGLITDGERYSILTDIQGLEDHIGDMDFKVAGTEEGITALQMDIKIKGLSDQIMAEALEQARQARLQILEVMNARIGGPAEMSPFAPRLTIIQINPEKIGAIIGPGGKTVRGIQEETGVTIDIEEDGTVYIASADGAGAERAREMVEELVEEAEIGRIYTGRVNRTESYGAFVEILPGIDGMVHISQLEIGRVERVEDVVRVGDEVMVMVINIEEGTGKIRLSRQGVLEGWTPEEARERGARTGGNRGGRGGSRGGGQRGGGSRGGSRSGGGGQRRR
jgi:polyribonucleotide nucleotidyltransferase